MATGGALCQVRGDWSFYKEIFGFPAWNEGGNMCWMCSASSQPDMPWTDFSWGAAWRHTLWTHDSYMRHLTTIGAPIPVLFSVIGLRLSSVMIDVLHTCDLGITCHRLANVFWLMAVVRTVVGGANIKAKFKKRNDHMKQ